jgi:uncharacterized membrane protein
MAEQGPLSLDAWTLSAIIAMALATYVCRALGVWMMGHVPLTKRVRLALAALPGSIVIATIIPLAIRGGPAAILALAAALASMLVRRNELLALFVGLGVVSLARAAGL